MISNSYFRLQCSSFFDKTIISNSCSQTNIRLDKTIISNRGFSSYSASLLDSTMISNRGFTAYPTFLLDSTIISNRGFTFYPRPLLDSTIISNSYLMSQINILFDSTMISNRGFNSYFTSLLDSTMISNSYLRLQSNPLLNNNSFSYFTSLWDLNWRMNLGSRVNIASYRLFTLKSIHNGPWSSLFHSFYFLLNFEISWRFWSGIP